MFSKSCKYAVRAVLYLAIKTNEESKMGVLELASKLDVPKHFLAKILQQLSKNKLVSSSKGRNGGFYLSEKNMQSNLLAVIEVFDGTDVFSECILGLDVCSGENPCPYHYTIAESRNEFLGQLQTETIADTAIRISKRGYKLKNKLKKK